MPASDKQEYPKTSWEVTHEKIQEADRQRIADHEKAERDYQRRFTEALRAAEGTEGEGREQTDSKKGGA